MRRLAIVYSHAKGGELAHPFVEIAHMLPIASVYLSRTHALFESRIPTQSGSELLRAVDDVRSFANFQQFSVKSLDLSSYEIVISDGESYVECGPNAVHICYRHRHDPSHLSPCGYLPSGVTWSTRLMHPFVHAVQRLGRRARSEPDYYLASSHVTADWIKRAHGRNAFVVHPPVDITGMNARNSAEDFLLIVSSVFPCKRIDMVISACNSAGRRLVIVGDGPDQSRLRSGAGPTVSVIGAKSPEEIALLLTRCAAVFCVDDHAGFDEMAVKANAAGKPAIAFTVGSAQETIVEGETGVLCSECTRPAIVDAIERCTLGSWNRALLRSWAERFSRQSFHDKLAAVLEDVVGSSIRDLMV